VENTSDFIDHPLPKHFASAHGAFHQAWAPGPSPSKSGAGMCIQSINISACSSLVKSTRCMYSCCCFARSVKTRHCGLSALPFWCYATKQEKSRTWRNW